jgi:hypothetical protein
MVKAYKFHKFFGLSASLVILILSITGFFLDHERWSFLYTTTFQNYPQTLQNADNRLSTSYYIYENNPKHILVGSKRGLFESFDAGKHFSVLLHKQVNAVKGSDEALYIATQEGVYLKNPKKLYPYALYGKYISALAVDKAKLAAVVEKKELYIIDTTSKKILKHLYISIAKEKLREDIKLSRFVRDLHYGRGLFDGDISLYINDFGAIILGFLALSGLLIWWYIRTKKAAKRSRRWIRYHANSITLLAFVPVTILLVTGIFLDHSRALSSFMKHVSIPHTILPPVYESLAEDIWSLDIAGNHIRIGNRYGVYGSDDAKSWEMESRGFAYSMSRIDGKLYVGGMGAPNRYYDGSWHILKGAQHMFKDIVKKPDGLVFFSSHQSSLALPTFDDVTLYSILLALHDGSFFASWWVWVNDFGAVAMFILFITGFYRWFRKRLLR